MHCYLIFSVIILKVKAPVGLLFTKHKDQLFVPSVPLTPREIVYIHPFLSIDWIEIIMYSSAFTPKSYVSFPDSAVITLLTDSIIGILLFHNTVAIQETHGFAPNVAQLFETFIVKPFFVTDP